MTFATPRTFQDFRTFVLRKHALHLKQQIVFGARSQRVIEKHDFDAVAVQFIHQQHLPRVLSGETIGRMNIQLLQAAGVRGIAKFFQCRTRQCRTADAVIKKAQLFRE